MYLPDRMLDAHGLITVKTYPLPSSKYEELVCTAGLLPDGRWIRIYPVPFRALPYEQQYQKYHWIKLDLIKNTSDFRPESYRPKHGLDEHITPLEKILTDNEWFERKKYVFQEVFTSMNDLIACAKGHEKKSLATLRPAEIVNFVIEPDEREWKKEWRDQFLQYNLFDLNDQGEGKKREIIRKLPYKYSYSFLAEGDTRPRTLMIEDWELGALYWKCFNKTKSEEEANRLVRQKYFDEFLSQKDIYLFLGTTKQYHMLSENPFIIIGVFYPPKPKQPKPVEAQQLTLF